MHREEVRCCIALFVLAGMTISTVWFFGDPYYIFIEYYPLNIFFILFVLACDVAFSSYFIVKTHKVVKRKTV